MLSLSGEFVPSFLHAVPGTVSLSFIRAIPTCMPFCVFPSLGKGCRVHHYSGIPQWASTRPDCTWLTGSGFLQPASIGPRFAGHPQGGGKQSQKGAPPDYSPHSRTPIPFMVKTTCVPRCGNAVGGMLYRFLWVPTFRRVYHPLSARGSRSRVISG